MAPAGCHTARTHVEAPPSGQPSAGLYPEADLPMDDLTARLADLFWRYTVVFRRMGLMSEAELEEETGPFRREMNGLIAEHGRDAVTRAALPTAGRAFDQTLMRVSFLAPRRPQHGDQRGAHVCSDESKPDTAWL